jgi:hypothetical protein
MNKLFRLMIPCLVWLEIVLLGVASPTASLLRAATPQPTVVAEQWQEIELAFTAESDHANPYTEVEFQVEFEGPQGVRLNRPGFWDGGKTFRVRFASPTAAGQWRWRSSATPADPGLHGKQGTITAAAYTGADALVKHGLLRMSPGMRTVIHADGTPFLMVADTPWALPWRATVDDARVYAQNRQAHGFNTALLMSLQPDRGENGPNARGTVQGFAVAFDDLKEGHINRINISYFQYFDQLRDILLAHGIVPVYQPVFHGFGWKGNNVLGQKMSAAEHARYCRYLVARYGAKPAIWLVGADSTGRNVGVKEGGEIIEQWDAYRQPTGLHYSPKASNDAFQDAAWLDFQWCQTGHGGRHRTDRVRTMYTNLPVKAVANGEPTYEGIKQPDQAAGWWQGHSAWLQYTSGGTMGLVYGAGGLWQWKITPDEPGWPDWANSRVSWREALELEGARYVGYFGKILRGLDVIDIPTRPDLAAGKLCLAKEGELYIVYLPEPGDVSLAHLKSGMNFRWLDPKTGRQLSAGKVTNPTAAFQAAIYPAVLIVTAAEAK